MNKSNNDVTFMLIFIDVQRCHAFRCVSLRFAAFNVLEDLKGTKDHYR